MMIEIGDKLKDLIYEILEYNQKHNEYFKNNHSTIESPGECLKKALGLDITQIINNNKFIVKTENEKLHLPKDQADIKHCPFCSVGFGLLSYDHESQKFYVLCNFCNAMGAHTQEAIEAIKAWNDVSK